MENEGILLIGFALSAWAAYDFWKDKSKTVEHIQSTGWATAALWLAVCAFGVIFSELDSYTAIIAATVITAALWWVAALVGVGVVEWKKAVAEVHEAQDQSFKQPQDPYEKMHQNDQAFNNSFDFDPSRFDQGGGQKETKAEEAATVPTAPQSNAADSVQDKLYRMARDPRTPEPERKIAYKKLGKKMGL